MKKGIQVDDTVYKICNIFLDQKLYLTVLCGHIMVRSKYFKYIFGDQLYIYIMVNKRKKKNQRKHYLDL